MIRVACAIAFLLVVPATHARADSITLTFEGTIESVIDASDPDVPPIDFTPAPVGSSFSGTYTYDIDSPLTNGGTGYSRYVDLLSSGGSVTINGFQFASVDAGAAIVASQEANFGYSGLVLTTQPISLPPDWSVANNSIPYFTVRFKDATPQSRSLALPSSSADIPTDDMELVVDFQQAVTVDGEEFGGRVFITGTITTLKVTVLPPPPQEVTIDVDPSSASNKINLNTKNGKPLEVAVLGAADFDVRDVVPETIQLGDPALTTGLPVTPSAIRYMDVNRDGKLDLLLDFDLRDLLDFGAIDSSSTSFEFQALLDNEGVVFGSDAVSILGSKGKGKK